MGETEALAQFSAAPGPPGLELPRVEPPDLRVSTVPTCHAAPVGHSPPPPRPRCQHPQLTKCWPVPPPPRNRHVGLFPQMRKPRMESKGDTWGSWDGRDSVSLLTARPTSCVCLLSIRPPPLVSTAAQSLGGPFWARGPPPRTPRSLRTQPLPGHSGLRRMPWEQRVRGAGCPGSQDRSPGVRVL